MLTWGTHGAHHTHRLGPVREREVKVTEMEAKKKVNGGYFLQTSILNIHLSAVRFQFTFGIIFLTQSPYQALLYEAN